MYPARLAGYYLRGGILTITLILAVGLFSLVGFDTLFLMFHQISFRNDLWQLNPYTDYLLLMFPKGFWFDATVRVATVTIIGAVIAAGGSASYLWWQGRERRRGIGHQPEGIDESQ